MMEWCLWSEATKKGVKGESPLARYNLATAKLESCFNNPSSRKTVKFNYDCECDGGIKIIMKDGLLQCEECAVLYACILSI